MQVIAETLSPEEIAGLKEMFKMIDTDNSGQITFDELKVGLKKFGANLKESEIYDLMHAVSITSIKFLPVFLDCTIPTCQFLLLNLHYSEIDIVMKRKSHSSSVLKTLNNFLAADIISDSRIRGLIFVYIHPSFFNVLAQISN